MTGYSESAMERKFSDLNNSAQSIQQLSLWLIHHRKHYQSIVKVWMHQLGKISHNKKLTFLYLANDVVQNSKKKHPEIAKEFGTCMKKVVEHMAVLPLDEKTVKSIARLLSIWQDRSIFDPKIQTELSRIWTAKTLELDANKSENASSSPSPKRLRSEGSTERRKSSSSESHNKKSPAVIAVKASPSENGSANTSVDVILVSNSSPAARSPSAADPPEPEELIKALQDLENTASSDAVVREKISRLPPEVSETAHLDKVETAEEGKKLLVQVNQATTLLADYNERLQQELQDRKRVDRMMVDFLTAQKDLLAQAEERLELYRDKLDKVNAVRDDLESHIQSLPDLTQLPDVTGGLAPLPSAGDLFTSR